MDQGQAPTSLEEIEGLIVQLYQPGPPERIGRIQQTLQDLQRSPGGWQLANGLLGRGEERVRFFGALTFAVKLNTDSKSLSEEDAQEVLQNLISWTIKFVANGEGPLVVRKLCSTLVTYFLQLSDSWKMCVKHLTYCLSVHQVVPPEGLEDNLDMINLIENLSVGARTIILWFATSLAEEVGKTDSTSLKHHKFHERLKSNANDVAVLIAMGIKFTASKEPLNTTVRQESMRAYQAWVLYSQRVFDTGTVFEPLRELLKPAIMCIIEPDLYEITVELLADVLSNYSSFLQGDHLQLLRSLLDSPWSQERYERLVRGDYDFDSLQFGQFMLAFGDATLQDLAKNCGTDPQSQQFLAALVGFLSAEGFAINEDKIFMPALEFWTTFVEYLLDWTYSEGKKHPLWLPPNEPYIMQVIEKCWHKVQFPPSEIYDTWDSSDRAGFADIRRDVLDLLQQAYLIIGVKLFSILVDLELQSITTKSWNELEVSLFFLSAFADNLLDEKDGDLYLGKLFGPPLFDLLTRSDMDVPLRTMQSLFSVIDAYPDYFQRHTEHLPILLNIMFGAVESPILARKASYTISKICSDCRASLTPEIGTFLQQYDRISHIPSLDMKETRVKERIMGAICSIVQAMQDNESKIAPIRQLLRFIGDDVDHCLRLASEPLGTAPENLALASDFCTMALACLESMGKGFRVPPDCPVDLEKQQVSSPFWVTGDGVVIQQQILSIITSIYTAFPNNGEIIESIFTVFRVGFTEREPGPFVFPLGVIAQFLIRMDLRTPRIGLAMGTACSMVNSRLAAEDHIQDVVIMLLTWISQLLAVLGDPSEDPEIAQNGIDFIHALLPKYLDVLSLHQPVSSREDILLFTLKALTGLNPLPKFSAAGFWSSFISIQHQEEPLQNFVENVQQHFGPLLAQALIYNIGGNAARSELDKLSEPLKKLVVNQARSKNWLELALLSDGFPSDKVTVKDKMAFLQKIINLRGAKGTNIVTCATTIATAPTPSSSPATPPSNSHTATCEFRTINYITDSLPQLCLKSSWSNTNASSSTKAADSGDTTSTSETHLTSGKHDDQHLIHRTSESGTAHEEPTITNLYPSETAKPSIADIEETENDGGELNDASFLSFEDWKKQTLEKAGQSNLHIGNKKSVVNEARKKDFEGIQNSLDSLGEEEEIEIDFAAFRSDGPGEEILQKTDNGDLDTEKETQEHEGVGRSKDQYRSKDAGITCKERFSYASFDAGATILKTHPEAKNAKAVLIENKDSYMLSECAAENKFLIVELSEDIWIDTLVLANYEFFSSMIRTFRVSVSDRYPVKMEKWKDLGIYEARNSREIQAFLIENPLIWARYLRIEFLSHYGNEYYCPLSLVRVHGTRMLESWKETEASGDDEDLDDNLEQQTEQFIPDAVATVIKVDKSDSELASSSGSVPNPAESVSDQTNSSSNDASMMLISPWVQSNISHPFNKSSYLEICLRTDASEPHAADSISTSLSAADPQQVPSEVSTGADPSYSALRPSLTQNYQHISLDPTPSEHASTHSDVHNSTKKASDTPEQTVSMTGKHQSVTSSTKNKTTGTSSASTSLPTIQESFFKAVSRRLQLLEANSTLSLKYIEEQSRILREAFSKVEKKQIQKATTFLEGLNNTVLAELRGFRQQYDEIWQSTVISLESQRAESQREILAISSRLNILADEVIFQKRMSIIQSVLLLLCLGLVIFSRVSSTVDFPNFQNRMRNQPSYPLETPLDSPGYGRVDPLRDGRQWLDRDESPPTPISTYSRSENDLTPQSGGDDYGSMRPILEDSEIQPEASDSDSRDSGLNASFQSPPSKMQKVDLGYADNNLAPEDAVGSHKRRSNFITSRMSSSLWLPSPPPENGKPLPALPSGNE
ncbi:hypothetical protein B7494_g7529 [Chlorociboria aeruginascens]|nr:hypothetical protein B7494_g7529 [Chlorociboria aeruginascens]